MKFVIFDDMKLSRSVIFAKNILVRIRSIDSAAFQVPIGIVVPKKSDRRDPAIIFLSEGINFRNPLYRELYGRKNMKSIERKKSNGKQEVVFFSLQLPT